MIDHSVRVSHLDRTEIMDGLGAWVNESYTTEKLAATLAIQFKKNHPIHKRLKNFTNDKLNGICANLSLPIPRHRYRKMKAISDYFFREYPDAPLTNLNKVKLLEARLGFV